MYSDVVMEVGKKYFEQLIDKMKEEKGVTQDVELTADDLKELADQFKAEYKAKIGADFPTDPKEQLMGAIKAVFRSWDNPRANVYRRDNDIPYSWGTAVNVQMMAFGNMGDDCGTGVAFTRDPATGEKKPVRRVPHQRTGRGRCCRCSYSYAISTKWQRSSPRLSSSSRRSARLLKTTTEICRIWSSPLKTASSTCSRPETVREPLQAALKIACDLVDEGMITEEEAVLMIDPSNLDTLLHPQFDAKALKGCNSDRQRLSRASPGAACGKIVFTAEDAKAWNARGEKVVLVRLETSPEDIEGMKAAQGILTVRGGMTSHAAVVARGMGTCCVSGCGDYQDGRRKQEVRHSAARPIHEGDYHLNRRFYR